MNVNFDGDVDINAFTNVEDGERYEAWLVTFNGTDYVLKKAKGKENEIYSAFFSQNIKGAPRLYKSVTFDGESYILIEFIEGGDMCRCDRDSLKRVLDALIDLQERFWKSDIKAGISFEESLEGRKDRGRYLKDHKLEEVYEEFLWVYESLPRTLCHDDLLPFNVLVCDKGATIIDWEVAGILPYPTSLARLIAHCEDTEDALFYMTNEDERFAIEYYYDNFVKGKGIGYLDYRYALDLFLFYEYCEWIMLGVKYDDADMDRYDRYLAKARMPSLL